MSIGTTKSEEDTTAETPDAETATDGIKEAQLLLVEITDVLIDREEEFELVALFAEVVPLLLLVPVTVVNTVDVVEVVPSTSDTVVEGDEESTIFDVVTLLFAILYVGAVTSVTVEFEGLAIDEGVEQVAVVVAVAGGVVEAGGSRFWLFSRAVCPPMRACSL